MPKAKHGINPVTIRGKDQYGRTLGLTLSRLWIQGPDDKTWQKLMCAAISLLGADASGGSGDDPDSCEPIAILKVDEELMTSGLYHLFPQGELDHAGEQAPALNQELVQAVRELTSLAALHGENVTKYKNLLGRCQL